LFNFFFNYFKTTVEESDDKNNCVDSASIKGIFGWESVNDIPLPVILREEERLVAVRIVESKVFSINNLNQSMI
jgi:hypothetical protein